jgi:hypothetical protein
MFEFHFFRTTDSGGSIKRVGIDNAGNINWQNCIGGSLDDFLSSDIQNSIDGGYIITGTTESNACTDYNVNNISRRINSSIFAQGVTVYGGSPNNPTPILGSSFCVYDNKLWNMNPSTGQVGDMVMTGQLQALCY